MTENKRPWPILLSIAAVISLTLILLFVPSLRDTILTPLIKAWISVRYALSILSERLQWTIALGLGFFLVLGSLLKRMPDPESPPRSAGHLQCSSESASSRLQHLLSRGSRSRFSREQTGVELRDLAARVLAYHEGLSLDVAKTRIMSEGLPNAPTLSTLVAQDDSEKRLTREPEFLSKVDRALSEIEHNYQEV